MVVAGKIFLCRIQHSILFFIYLHCIFFSLTSGKKQLLFVSRKKSSQEMRSLMSCRLKYSVIPKCWPWSGQGVRRVINNCSRSTWTGQSCSTFVRNCTTNLRQEKRRLVVTAEHLQENRRHIRYWCASASLHALLCAQ